MSCQSGNGFPKGTPTAILGRRTCGAEMTAGEKAFFADMREVHFVNIEKCRKLVS